jgi:hypothetical protein
MLVNQLEITVVVRKRRLTIHQAVKVDCVRGLLGSESEFEEHEVVVAHFLYLVLDEAVAINRESVLQIETPIGLTSRKEPCCVTCISL